MNRISYRPNGKINLGLVVRGRRNDGFHLVESLLYPVSISDKLEIEIHPGSDCEIVVEGISLDCEPEQNICYSAWKKLRDHHPSIGGVRISIEKKIPPGSGLGGGSSDAAFTLRGLREIFAPEISDHELELVASQIGSDVPFFLHNKPMVASGTGTELEEYPLFLSYEIKIINSEIHSSTAEAYGALDLSKLDTSRSVKNMLKFPVSEWKDHLVNDLEIPVFQKYPSLKKIKESLYDQGAIYAAMSGSGSSVFGLFES